MKIQINKEDFTYQIGGMGKYYDWYKMAGYIVKKYYQYLEENEKCISYDFYLMYEEGRSISMTHIEYDPEGYTQIDNNPLLEFDSDCFDGCLDIHFISIYADYEVEYILSLDDKCNIEEVKE